MPADAQLIALPGQKSSRVQSPGPRTAFLFAIRSLLKPHTIVLFILTMALVTWGYADRLTRYKNSPDPLKRTLVARFWVDQQSNQRNISAKLQPPSHSLFDLFLPVESPQPISHWYAETILSAPRAHRAVSFIHPLLPLRSPPSASVLA